MWFSVYSVVYKQYTAVCSVNSSRHPALKALAQAFGPSARSTGHVPPHAESRYGTVAQSHALRRGVLKSACFGLSRSGIFVYFNVHCVLAIAYPRLCVLFSVNCFFSTHLHPAQPASVPISHLWCNTAATERRASLCLSKRRVAMIWSPIEYYEAEMIYYYCR